MGITIKDGSGKGTEARVTPEQALFISGLTVSIEEYALFDKELAFTAHTPEQALTATTRVMLGFLKNTSATDFILLQKVGIHWNGGTQATTTYSAPVHIELETNCGTPTVGQTTGVIYNRDLRSGKTAAGIFMYGTGMTAVAGTNIEYSIVFPGGVFTDVKDAGYLLNPGDSVGVYAYVDSGITGGKIIVSFDFIQTDFQWFEGN